jgi:hypothetical protein
VTLLVTARHLPPAFSATAPASVAPATTPPPAPSRSSSAAAPSSSLSGSSTPAPVGPVGFLPTSLTLAAFSVTAPVDPVFTAGGVLDPPDDVSRVGWWGGGQLAGAATGAVVVVGHVDGPEGPGALYRLVHTRPGDRITVAGDNGRRQEYAVTSLQYHGKGSALPASLFAVDGPPHLVLISCGGPFDRSTDQYQDNVVVQAAPV